MPTTHNVNKEMDARLLLEILASTSYGVDYIQLMTENDCLFRFAFAFFTV